MVSRSKVLAVLIPAVVMLLVIAAGSSVMARPGLWCPAATPCVATTAVKAEVGEEGWLGVEVQELTPELREVMGIEEGTEGVLVAGVTRNSPADKAGIMKGDVITFINSMAVKGTSELVNDVGKKKPGEIVTVVLTRDGRQKSLKVTLGRRQKTGEEETIFQTPKPRAPEKESPPEIERPPEGMPREESFPGLERLKLQFDRGRLGVDVVDLNSDLGSYFGTRKGVLVTQVLDGTAAEEAGIRAGDVIVAVDGKPVSNREELVKLLSDKEVGDKVRLSLLRKGKEMKLSATLEEGPFTAWFEGMRRKGSSVQGRYITPRVEQFKGNAELQRSMDELSRQVDKLREEIDRLKEDLKSKRK